VPIFSLWKVHLDKGGWRILVGNTTDGGAVRLRLIKRYCGGVWISAGLLVYALQLTVCFCSVLTGAKFDLSQNFQSVTVLQVRDCLCEKFGACYRKNTESGSANEVAVWQGRGQEHSRGGSRKFVWWWAQNIWCMKSFTNVFGWKLWQIKTWKSTENNTVV
jgi:hypothetical protein